MPLPIHTHTYTLIVEAAMQDASLLMRNRLGFNVSLKGTLSGGAALKPTTIITHNAHRFTLSCCSNDTELKCMTVFPFSLCAIEGFDSLFLQTNKGLFLENQGFLMSFKPLVLTCGA